MVALTWDAVGTRTFETGVDHGVLYTPDGTGAYATGVAWNGLVSVTETPAGAEATPTYADNIKYLNLISVETFGATIEAYTYPPEWNQHDGSVAAVPGVVLGQQARKMFGLSYRTRFGDDVDGDSAGYKLHLVYGAIASPSEKAYNTVNDSPEAITFSWDVTTTPVPSTGHRPVSLITIDSTTVDPTDLAAFEAIIYGGAATTANLPLPDAVIAAFPP